MENEYDSFYPPKPFLEQEKQRTGHIAVTVFSLLLFVLSFILFFDAQLSFILQIALIVLFHELGHFICMKLFGYQNVRMLFIPLMGAFVHGKKESYKQKESVLVVLAGPLPGVILGIFFWVYGCEHSIDWMKDSAILLFILNILNLIPILPLDGGRLLSNLFLDKIEFIQVAITFISSLALIGLGWYLEWYVLMIFGFLMGFQVRSLHRRYLIHKGLQEEEVEYTETYENLSDRSYHFIKKHVLDHTPGLKRFIEQADEQDFGPILANEVRNVLKAPVEKDLTVFFKFIVIICWLSSFIVPFYLLWSYGLFSTK